MHVGLVKAAGKYIARMDGDDVCLTTRFIRQVSFVEQNLSKHVLGTAVHVISSPGVFDSTVVYPITRFMYWYDITLTVCILNPNHFYRAMALACAVAHPR